MLRDVEELEKITFGKRLKDLMTQKNGENKQMSQIELKNLLDKMNDNREVVTTATISKWVRGKAGLRKNKDEILQYLSIIFDVDIAYLNCTQVEKKINSEKDYLKNHKLAEEDYMFKVFKDYLKSIGITIKVSNEPIEPPEEVKTIIDNTIYKGYRDNYKKTSFILQYKGKKKLISNEAFEKFRKDIFSYTGFLFNNLNEI